MDNSNNKKLLDLVVYALILLVVYWVAGMIVSGVIHLVIGLILVILFVQRLM